MQGDRQRFSVSFDGVCSTEDSSCLIAGEHFQLNDQALSKCYTPLLHDLLRIGRGVYVTDRLARRRQRQGGIRDIRLSIQVAEPDFWRCSTISGLIKQALELIGGDFWALRFLPLTDQEDKQMVLTLPANHLISSTAPLVCLYSGGLDSAAGLAARLSQHKGSVLAVTAWHQMEQPKTIETQLKRLRQRFETRIDSAVVKTMLKGSPPLSMQESTQRCRSFLFTTLGGIAAASVGATEVEVYESGVGAINLPLMTGMLIGGHATKGCHPEFLRLMGELVSHVAERRIAFVLPFQTYTKAEVVGMLTEQNLAVLANATVSCASYPLHVANDAKQCGVCPACIGRRQALAVANIREPAGKYQYDFLGCPDEFRRIPVKKLNYLKATLMQVADLLALQPTKPLPELVKRHLFGSRIATDDQSALPWVELLMRYRDEWLGLMTDRRTAGLPWVGWLGETV